MVHFVYNLQYARHATTSTLFTPSPSPSPTPLLIRYYLILR